MKLVLTAALALVGALASAQSWNGSDPARRDNDWNRGNPNGRGWNNPREDREQRIRIERQIRELEDRIRMTWRTPGLSRWERERRIDALQDRIRDLRLRLRNDRRDDWRGHDWRRDDWRRDDRRHDGRRW